MNKEVEHRINYLEERKQELLATAEELSSSGENPEKLAHTRNALKTVSHLIYQLRRNLEKAKKLPPQEGHWKFL